MAVVITTVGSEGVETVHAKVDTLVGAWDKAWEVYEKTHAPAKDWTGFREGPEVRVRYTLRGEE